MKVIGIWLISVGMGLYGKADFFELISEEVISCGWCEKGKCTLKKSIKGEG